MARCAPFRVRRCHLGRRGSGIDALASLPEITLARATSILTALGAAIGLTSCGTFAPEPHAAAPFHQRTESKDDGDFRVTIAALSREETTRFLGLDLEEKGVQPVWVEIENRTDRAAWYLPIGTDPAYFAPNEVAYMFHHWWAGDRSRRIADHLLTTSIPLEVPARGGVRGFVYTHTGQGAPFVRVELLDDHKLREFRFVARYPGGKWDFQRIDFDALYPASAVRDLDLPGFLAELDMLPCCAADARGRPEADPLNIVLVGSGAELAFPLVQRGWNLTEPVHPGSAWRSVKAFLLGTPYLTSPVSPLHLFGRPQDAALQKPRNDIDQRNHLRIWLAPFTLQGKSVWVGQVSRDIGVRFTTRSWYLTTHKIDPDVDEDRDYLLQDLTLTGFVNRIGLLPGVGEAPRSAPRHNLTGDPYFTDGKRLVMVLDAEPRPMDRVEVIVR